MRKSLLSLRQTITRQPAEAPAKPAPGRPVQRRPAAPVRPAAGAPAQRLIGANFVREVYAELKKVVWPTREEATNLTAVVIVVSVAVGLMLGATDFVFSWLVNTVLVGG